jgi:hypothetical protein
MTNNKRTKRNEMDVSKRENLIGLLIHVILLLIGNNVGSGASILFDAGTQRFQAVLQLVQP